MTREPTTVLLCIQTGKTVNDPNRMKFYTDQFYFKSSDEMALVFGDYPELLSRTGEIADRCKNRPSADWTIRFPNSTCPRALRSIPISRRLCGTGMGNGWNI